MYQIQSWLSSGLLHRAVWEKFIDVSEVLDASIIRAMMEAASTSEMLLNYQTMWHNNPEDGDLHTHCCVNLKSHYIPNLTATVHQLPLLSSEVKTDLGLSQCCWFTVNICSLVCIKTLPQPHRLCSVNIVLH
jgi:hypothetical protein